MLRRSSVETQAPECRLSENSQEHATLLIEILTYVGAKNENKVAVSMHKIWLSVRDKELTDFLLQQDT